MCSRFLYITLASSAARSSPAPSYCPLGDLTTEVPCPPAAAFPSPPEAKQKHRNDHSLETQNLRSFFPVHLSLEASLDPFVPDALLAGESSHHR